MKFPIKLIALFCALFTFTQTMNAQSLHMGFEAGTGISYIGEATSENAMNDFNPSMVISTHLKFTPKDSYFGVRLNLMNVSTLFSSNTDVWSRGQVNTLTTSLILEHLNTEKKFSIGYFFGMGVTRENYLNKDWYGNKQGTSNFMSVSGGGLITYGLGEKSRLLVTPSFFWTDPLNTFRKDHWVQAGEDIAFLFQLGYSYKLQ